MGLTETMELTELWEKYKIDSDNKELMAAYALNLCTVSVSQIVDYNDVYILEQEYDAILNNLNLENIPKDSSLRNILVEILNTITFFKIYDKKKELIEKRYQQQMKTKIWESLPTFGAIIVSKNPLLIAGSLALQVGSSYMNYRKGRENAISEKEKAEQELEFTAMEQLNALQRELFSTAWDLAGKYEYDDVLRLTEKQIHQYNQILCDPDPICRYERLEAIAHKFIAYPPFWYQFANTANEIAMRFATEEGSDLNEEYAYKVEENIVKKYREAAKEYYDIFLKFDECNILREDIMTAMGYLEYIDLIYDAKNPETIKEIKKKEYLPKAVSHAGNSNDILQLCAVAYIKIDELKEACNLLKRLINDGYNRTMNAQLLDGLLINLYMRGEEKYAITKYELMRHQVDERFILPIEKCIEISKDEAQRKYIELFQSLIKKEYALVIKQIVRKYNVEYNKVLPTANEHYTYDELYFYDTNDNAEIRCQDVVKVFNTSEREDYVYRLKNVVFPYAYLDILNRFFSSIAYMDVLSEGDINELKKIITRNIENNSGKMASLQIKMDSPDGFLAHDFEELFDISFNTFFDSDTKKKLNELLRKRVSELNEISDCIKAENTLVRLCEHENIPDPDYLLSHESDILSFESRDIYFAKGLLDDRIKDDLVKLDKRAKMKELINDAHTISNDESKCEIIDCDGQRFKQYCRKYEKQIKSKRLDILFIIDDRTVINSDLIFTMQGVIPMMRRSVKPIVEYDEVSYSKDGKALMFDTVRYENRNADINKIKQLCEKLSKIG